MNSKRIARAVALLSLGVSTSALAQSAASDFTHAARYDAARRVVGTIAPDPDGAGSIKYAATRNTYDTAGRLTKVETGELAAWQSESVEPSSWTGFTIHRTVEISYDLLGRKLKEVVKGSDGNPYQVAQYSYDTLGRPECTAIRMNPAVFASLPSDACTLGNYGDSLLNTPNSRPRSNPPGRVATSTPPARPITPLASSPHRR